MSFKRKISGKNTQTDKADLYVVVIGGANVDIQGFPEKALVMHDSAPGDVKLSCGGVGRNIAENLSRLGCDVRLITVFGKDALSFWLKQKTSSAGVDVANCMSVDGEVPMYLSILEKSGDMAVAVSSMKLLCNLNVKFIETKASLIEKAAAVVIDANLPRSVISYLLSSFPNAIFFADPVSAAKAGVFCDNMAGLFCIKPNMLEAAALAGDVQKNNADAEAIGGILLKKGVKHVIISMGSDGVYCCNKEERFYSPAFHAQVRNCTGAGDAFMAALVYEWLYGTSFKEAVAFAQGAAKMALECDDTINSNISVENIRSLL